MIKLIPNYTKLRLKNIQELYINSFPESERKPFSLILEKCKTGSMEILSIENNGIFSGFVIIIKYKDIVLIDYLAICENMRNHNIGSDTLKIINDIYLDKRIMLEIENSNINCDNIEERARRKKFYLRNGMNQLNYLVDLFGVEMEILTFGSDIAFEEYHEIFINVFSKEIAEKVKLIKYI